MARKQGEKIGKTPRSSVYRDANGRTLFVPTEKMWEFRKLIKTQPGASDNSIAQAIGITSSSVISWRHRHRDLPSFAAWLLGGDDCPADFVASPTEVKRARVAWDYWTLLNSLGVDETLYYQWFDLFPQDEFADWVRWLYGWDDPEGWYIIPEWVMRLRARLSIPGIARAAGISVYTVYEWFEDPVKESAIKQAVQHRRHPDTAEWRDLASRKRPDQQRLLERMFRFASAASLSRACADTRLDPDLQNGSGIKPNTWVHQKQTARRRAGKDAEHALTAFVEQFGTGRVGRPQCGRIAPGLFLPPNSMRSFREAARRRCSEQTLYHNELRIGKALFDRWMLDWILRRKDSRRNILDGQQFQTPTPAGRSWSFGSEPPEGAERAPEAATDQPPPATIPPGNGHTLDSTPVGKSIDDRKPVAQTPSVTLFGPREEVILKGKSYRRLANSQYLVIRELMRVHPDGLSKNQLNAIPGVDAPRQTLIYLSKTRPEFVGVVHFSTHSKSGYSID